MRVRCHVAGFSVCRMRLLTVCCFGLQLCAFTLIPLMLACQSSGRDVSFRVPADPPAATQTALDGPNGAVLSPDVLPASPVSPSTPVSGFEAGFATLDALNVDPQPMQDIASGLRVQAMFAPAVGALDLTTLAAQASANASLSELARWRAKPTPNCGAGTPVRVYQWPDDHLPPERFGTTVGANQQLQGLYLSSSEVAYDAIVVTTDTDAVVYEVLVHEFAHYWYHRSCGDSRRRQSTEAFAEVVRTQAGALGGGPAMLRDGGPCAKKGLFWRKRCR